MRIPTVKFMVQSGFSKINAEFIRSKLQYFKENLSNPSTTLHDIAKQLKTDVEFIPKGQNQKSPEITYVNTGDLYDITIMWINNHFVVGSVAHYIERGNYQKPYTL